MSERAASAIAGLARLLAGATARTTGFIPDPSQRIYYANHTSHLDFVVLWSALPKDVRRLTRPVAARDYWEKRGIRGWLAREVFNAILIDRSGAEKAGNPSSNPIDEIDAAMGDRFSIIIFPEGTRGSGEEVAPFKSGIYHLAGRRPGIELVPAYMENLNRILPKGAIVPVPLLSSIVIGMPIRLEEGETKGELLERAREELLKLRRT